MPNIKVKLKHKPLKPQTLAEKLVTSKPVPG